MYPIVLGRYGRVQGKDQMVHKRGYLPGFFFKHYPVGGQNIEESKPFGCPKDIGKLLIKKGLASGKIHYKDPKFPQLLKVRFNRFCGRFRHILEFFFLPDVIQLARVIALKGQIVVAN
jgi:hypothetical protein